MLGFVLVLMIPPGGTLAPLFVLLNSVGLRNSLLGLAIAFTSTALPFAIWNLKGYIDSLPYDLEEAAQIDGCTRAQGFIKVILPDGSSITLPQAVSASGTRYTDGIQDEYWFKGKTCT